MGKPWGSRSVWFVFLLVSKWCDSMALDVGGKMLQCDGNDDKFLISKYRGKVQMFEKDPGIRAPLTRLLFQSQWGLSLATKWSP